MSASPHAPSAVQAPPSAPRRITAALLVGVALFTLLGWILAWVVWLWFLFGLFFFLIAALIATSFVFRILRPLRPMSTRAVMMLCAALGLAGWLTTVTWEYRHVADTAGAVPHLSAARNELVKRGRDPREVDAAATAAFRARLAADYAPGGVLGYMRWASSAGEMKISLDPAAFPGPAPHADTVSISHRGWGWPARAALALSLMILGVWWQLADLRAGKPVQNLIDPDEADELEREEKREYGEPGFTLFEHTADMGIEARANDWQGLLEETSQGLLAAIGKLVPQAANKGERVRVDLAAASREELLHDWLAEVLFLFETRDAMVDGVTFKRAEPTRLVADVTLRPLDHERSRFDREVKAVTYHDLKVEDVKRGWRKKGLTARVILDI